MDIFKKAVYILNIYTALSIRQIVPSEKFFSNLLLNRL